mgnify:CR=1 FL=1
MKILIMTVGGDPNPVVQSINEMKPDYIYFICSSGQQTSRVTIEGPSKPKVLEQTKFPLENIKIVEVEPDDPGGVYEMAKRIIAECEGHEVYATLPEQNQFLLVCSRPRWNSITVSLF